MARRTYAAEIRELYRGANEAKKTRSDERYRQQVLGETIRSNQEKESIQRETLNNQLNIQGSYRSRATDKTGDLQRGQNFTLDLGLQRDSTVQRGQDRNYNLGLMGNLTQRRGQDKRFELGMAGVSKDIYGIDSFS